jgi:hypothetical protein
MYECMCTDRKKISNDSVTFYHLKAEIYRPRTHTTSVHNCGQYCMRETCFQVVHLLATLHTRMWEVVGSNSGRNTGYPDSLFFHDFLQSFQTISTSIRPRPIPIKSFPIYHSISWHATLCSLHTESVVKYPLFWPNRQSSGYISLLPVNFYIFYYMFANICFSLISGLHIKL